MFLAAIMPAKAGTRFIENNEVLACGATAFAGVTASEKLLIHK